jgi:hypothetical protein
MNRTQTIRKHAAHDRGRRPGGRNPNALRRRERLRNVTGVPRPRTASRFCPDWHSLRIWEDDGGGQIESR